MSFTSEWIDMACIMFCRSRRKARESTSGLCKLRMVSLCVLKNFHLSSAAR